MTSLRRVLAVVFAFVLGSAMPAGAQAPDEQQVPRFAIGTPDGPRSRT